MKTDATTRPRWTRLWKKLGCQESVFDVYDRLVSDYEKPPRAYHNLAHISDCLIEFDQVRHLAMQPAIVEVAIWYHDAVYDTHANDNEEQSARIAGEDVVAKGLQAELAKQVKLLINATKHQGAHSDCDAQLIVDIDLSILGKPPTAYSRYADAIRTEYSWVPLSAYCSGRTQVLQSFLDREQIYQTKTFRLAYEERARENISREIAEITKNLHQQSSKTV